MAVDNKPMERYARLMATCFYGIFFGLCWLFFYRMVYHGVAIQAHIKFAESLAAGIKLIPHLGYFYILWFFKVITALSWRMAAAFLLSIFATLNAMAVHFVFKRCLPGYSTAVLLGLTAITMTVAAIYVPFFNKAIYFGQGSPNMWHNSTVIAVKAISILTFYMAINLIENRANQHSWKYIGSTAALMALSVFIKPTFMIVLLPAVGLYILFKHRKEFDIYWKITITALPAIGLMLYQYINLYSGRELGVHGVQRTSELDILTVWRMFTPNVFVSILITIAFPLAVLVFRYRSVIKNNYLIAAWIAMIAGMLQFALFAEHDMAGRVIRSANWIGGYLIGLTLVFVFTMPEFANWLKGSDYRDRIENSKIWFTSILLALHTFSGFCYIYDLLINGRTAFIFYT